MEFKAEKIHCDTVYVVLDKLSRVQKRPISAPMRMPMSDNYKVQF